MATSFHKPQIPRRERIPVSEEARRQAMEGMGGEKVKRASEASAAEKAALAEPTLAVVEADALAPVEAAESPVVVPEAIEEPAVAPVPDTVPAATAIAPAPELVEMPLVVAPRRKSPGRKQTATTASSTDQPLQSVHLFRGTIHEIKLNLLLLPDAPDNPANIRQYIEAALALYEAQLRKQGKLPAK